MRTTITKWLLLGALAALVGVPAPALADEASTPQATAGTPAAEVTALSPAEFKQDTRGVFLHGTYVLELWGKGLPVHVGVQWAGVRTFDGRRHLFTFDAAAALTAVYGGNSSERFYLLGGNLRGLGEFGLRTTADDLAFYVGGTLLLNGTAAASLTKPLDQLNPLEGIAGVYGVGALRVNGGLSWLQGDKALLVTVFIGESLRHPGSAVNGPLYTDLGARAQFDVARSFTAALEGSWGTTFGRADAATGFTNAGSRYEVTLQLRKHLGPVWVGIDGQLHGTANTATSTAATYVTATPTFVSAGATFGVSL
jgi:hypothetical protein